MRAYVTVDTDRQMCECCVFLLLSLFRFASTLLECLVVCNMAEAGAFDAHGHWCKNLPESNAYVALLFLNSRVR